MQTSDRISKCGRLPLDVAIESRARLHTCLAGILSELVLYFQCHNAVLNNCVGARESRSTVDHGLRSEIV